MDASGTGSSDTVTTTPPLTPTQWHEVHETKYELNSLINVFKLSTAYYAATKDLTCFKDSPSVWIDAAAIILDMIEVQQAGTDEDYEDPLYKFQRQTTVATDTLMNGGLGVPARRCVSSRHLLAPLTSPCIKSHHTCTYRRFPCLCRCGMTKSYFRASDDAVTLPFNVADNAFAVVQLKAVAPLLTALGRSDLADNATTLAGGPNEACSDCTQTF